MRRSDQQGALALLAAIAATGLLAAPPLAIAPADLPGAAAASLPGAAQRHAGLISATGAVVVVAWALRALVVRRTLRSRVRLTLLPADSFDPPLEAVQRFAAQLTRTRRATGAWLDAPASAVRVLLATDPDGQLTYQLEAPARALPALRAAAAAYGELTVTEQPATRRRRAPNEPPRRGVARAELALARSSGEPLAEPVLDPDPLQSIAAATADLQLGLGERAVIALDLRPLTPGQARRQRTRLLTRARPATPGSASDAGGPGRPMTPGAAVARRIQARALHDKLGTPQPLLGMRVLLQAEAASPARARARLQALLSALDVLAGHNHLRVRGQRVAGLAFLGADAPWRRRRFDQRLRTGLVRRGGGVVSAGEIAGLLKPPTRRCHAANVARSGGAVAPPPAGLPTFTGQGELIPLGRVTGPAGERLAGVPVSDTVFSYLAGRSRYGKTETAIGQFVHLARSGHGGLFLDPHADAIREIKAYLTDPGVRERVIEIDLADHQGRHGQPGWNLFATHGRPAWEAAERVEAVVDAFAAALGWDDRNTRALNLTTQAALALTALARQLPPALAPTIFQVPTLLSDEQWRTGVLGFLPAASRQFFCDRFPRLPADAITPVTNLIDRLRAAGPVAALLGAPVSTFDARRAIEQGRIVLACPGAGSTRDRLLANLLVYELLHACKARAGIPAQRRRPFWLFLDELQTYDGPNLPALLEQSAKYGGRAFLFNQNPERLSDATLNAVTTNRSHLATTAVNAKAAGLLAREWGGEPTPATITQLPRYQYLTSVTLGDRTTRPFLVHGIRARELHAGAHHPEQLPALERAIDHATRRQPLEHVLAALDQHDQRILRHLHGHDCARPDGTPDPGGRTVTLPALPTRPEDR